MKKDPKYVYSNDVDILNLYQNFDRTHIFSEHSVPKKLKKFHTKNELVNFFLLQFNKGVISYNDIMATDQIQNFLHYQNLKITYENCLTNFYSKRIHYDNMQVVFELIENQSVACLCIQVWHKFPIKIIQTQVLNKNKLIVAEDTEDYKILSATRN